MISLTEADLLAMREVQAVSNLPWYSDSNCVFGPDHHGICRATNVDVGKRYGAVRFIVAASTGWPRLTEWALEARRFLTQKFPGHARDCSTRAANVVMTCDCGYDEARRLVGEP